jgi:hypothetical protein
LSASRLVGGGWSTELSQPLVTSAFLAAGIAPVVHGAHDVKLGP